MTSAVLGKRLQKITESVTILLNAKAQELQKKGIPVINLTAGEPDFYPPDAVKEAVIAAVEANKSRYTAAPGILELRQLVAEKTNRQQPALSADQPWGPKNTIITNGAKQALSNALMVLVDPGEEVLIPSPYWLSYPEMAKLVDAEAKILPTIQEADFKLSPEQLRKAIGPKSKVLILNSPSNPTGCVYSKAEFQALGRILAEPAAQHLWIVSDEIYDRITFEQPFCSFLEACPALRDRVITINGMSKSLAMTGWRVGWAVGREDFIQGMNNLQGQTTSNVNALAQWASVAGLRLPEHDLQWQIDTYRRRRDIALEILQKSGKLKVYVPRGAFYLFVGVADSLQPGEDSVGYAERLLDQEKVSLVPGTPFGAPDYVRMSFATDERTLQDGCERWVRWVESQDGAKGSSPN